MTTQRVLAAVLFTDTVGFTKRTGEDEEEAFRLLSADFAIMRELAEKYEGQVKKSTGDGLLMVFQSAIQAVSCAIEIQRILGLSAKNNPRALKHRIGIHLGDIMLSDADVVGDGVNVANRLQGEAQPGAICLSQTVFDIVKSKMPIQARALGERQLRNVTTSVNVFEIPPLFGPRPRGKALPPLGRTPKGSKGGLVFAIVFAGLCVVAAAIIFSAKVSAARQAKNAAAAGTTAGTQGESRHTKGSDIASKPSADPVAGTADGSTQGGASPAGSNSDTSNEETPVQSPDELQSLIPTQADIKQSYEDARKLFKATYDFSGMVEWLVGQAWIADPGGKRLREHWQRLKRFRDELLAGLTAKPGVPIKVGQDEFTFLKGTTINVSSAGADAVQTDLGELHPEMIQGLAQAIGESPQLLKAFQIEYGLQG